ncbi:MAG TPA: hypothetical protein VHV47_02240 [Opitutaceae bacterium]|nr:hypothetical protein [Opitutaceae bacterium]
MPATLHLHHLDAWGGLSLRLPLATLALSKNFRLSLTLEHAIYILPDGGVLSRICVSQLKSYVTRREGTLVWRTMSGAEISFAEPAVGAVSSAGGWLLLNSGPGDYTITSEHLGTFSYEHYYLTRLVSPDGIPIRFATQGPLVTAISRSAAARTILVAHFDPHDESLQRLELPDTTYSFEYSRRAATSQLLHITAIRIGTGQTLPVAAFGYCNGLLSQVTGQWNLSLRWRTLSEFSDGTSNYLLPVALKSDGLYAYDYRTHDYWTRLKAVSRSGGFESVDIDATTNVATLIENKTVARQVSLLDPSQFPSDDPKRN